MRALGKDETMGQEEFEKWEKFRRWQKITIEQFSTALALVISLDVAALGFGVTFLKEAKTSLDIGARLSFLWPFGILGLSAASGLLCVINRLDDFRKTAHIAKKKAQGATDKDLEELRTETDVLGTCTWALFKIATVGFGVGVIALVRCMWSTLFIMN